MTMMMIFLSPFLSSPEWLLRAVKNDGVCPLAKLEGRTQMCEIIRKP